MIETVRTETSDEVVDDAEYTGTKPIVDKYPSRFKKGDPRINRKGRMKKGQSLAEKFRDALAEKVDGDYTKLDAIIDVVMKAALKGNLPAVEFLLARGWGKLIDRVELRPKFTTDLSRLTTIELDELTRLTNKIDSESTLQLLDINE